MNGNGSTAVAEDKDAALKGKLAIKGAVNTHSAKELLPAALTPRDGITFLQGHVEVTRFSRIFKYRPWDGGLATKRVLERLGVPTVGIATKTIFGDDPPEARVIQTGLDETEQIPWGEIALPAIEGKLHLTGASNELGVLFRLIADAPSVYGETIESLFDAVQAELDTNSLYRGKAMDGEMNFLDLHKVKAESVIYSAKVQDHLEANIWSLIRYTQAMREQGIPLKRTILLEGPYGTGKTLTSYLTGQIADENGWTFLYCRPNQDTLREVMTTARLYQPCVVFAEDVDIMASPDEYANDISDVLDLFDGIEAKGTEIVVVLTTNHADKIHKGMWRPGRLDGVVSFDSLDQAGVQRMVEVVVPASLLGDLDYAALHAAMEGYVPAFVKEVVDRAMRYGIVRGKGKATSLTTDDFVKAAEGLRAQYKLMDDASEEMQKRDPLGSALRREIQTLLQDARITNDRVGDSEFDFEEES